MTTTITPLSSLSAAAIQDFFCDNPNEPYKPPLSSPPHTLEQSICQSIVGTKLEYGVTWYYCKLHPMTEVPEYKDLELLFSVKTHIVDIRSIHLETIEHHCKYYMPQTHMNAILKALKL